MSVLGVGLVGLSADATWASLAHLPAIREVPTLELRAVCGRSLARAQAAATVHRVPMAFANPAAMAVDSDIDLVVVAVRVSRHAEVVRSMLPSGTAVLCEWPLARDVREAAALVDVAEPRPMFVGMHGRCAPALRHVRELVEQGYVGEVLSTSAVVSSTSWGGAMAQAGVYMLNPEEGATVVSVTLAHLLDAVDMTLGPLVSVSARSSIRRPWVVVRETGERVRKGVPDNVALHGVLEGGAVCSVHLRAGITGGTVLLWEIKGSEGDLTITGRHGNVQYGELVVSGSRHGAPYERIELPRVYTELRSGGLHTSPLVHVYDRLGHDLASGCGQVADFAHALRLHRTIDAIERSARQGAQPMDVSSVSGTC